MGCMQDTFESDDKRINLMNVGFDMTKIKPCKVKLNQCIDYRKTNDTMSAISFSGCNDVWGIDNILPRLFAVGECVNILYNEERNIDGKCYYYISQIYHIKSKTLYCS